MTVLKNHADKNVLLSYFSCVESDYVHSCHMCVKDTLKEENFYQNLNFSISLMRNSLKLNSAYYEILGNLSMIAAYTIDIHQSK